VHMNFLNVLTARYLKDSVMRFSAYFTCKGDLLSIQFPPHTTYISLLLLFFAWMDKRERKDSDGRRETSRETGKDRDWKGEDIEREGGWTDRER
jgi:hypothetical protein